MKNTQKTLNSKVIAVGIAVCFVLILSSISSIALAQPLTTVKVNGEKLLMDGFPDIVMLEAKAKLDGNAFVSGSGSMHGIICQATYFFQLTGVTTSGDSITMYGTITGTNKATRGGVHDFYSWIFDYPDIEITANLDGSNMHVIFLDLGLDFTGNGHVNI